MDENEVIRLNLGHATAYAYYKAGGGTATEEEFTQLMADLGIQVENLENMVVVTNTLDPGTPASATYEDGVLTLNIPKGATGDPAPTEEIVPAVDAWLAENINPETGYALDRSLTASNAAAPADMVGDLKSALNGSVGIINGTEFEGFTKKIDNLTGTVYSDTIISQSGNMTTSSGWTVFEFDAVPGQVYLVTAQGAPVAIVAKDTGGNVVDVYKPGANVNINDYEYAPVSGTTKIFLNRGSNRTPYAKAKYGNPYIITGDLKDSVNTASEVKDMTIEGYKKDYVDKTGTLHTGEMWTGEGFSTLSDWYCLEMNVIPGANYLFSGTGNPMFTVHNADGEKIDQFRPGANTNYNNKEYTAPNNAVKIYLNRKTYIPIAKEQSNFNFIYEDSPTLATTSNGEVYTVGQGNFVHTVGMHSSANGTFNYETLTYDGASFKTVSDDVAPIQTDAGYVGGNHGYNYGYECTATGHGYTDADIGKTYDDGTNTWVLLKILSDNKFLIGCYDSTAWFRLKEATRPESVNFGSSVTISSSSLAQIRPSVKNVSSHIIENSKSVFKVYESYDIIDIGVGIEALKNNVGDNDNDSLAELSDSIFKVTTVYEFNNSGAVTLYQNLQVLKDNVARLAVSYGTQVNRIEATGDLFAVPGTSFPTLQNAVLNAAKETWDDINIAPSVFVKTNGSKNKGFAVAYILDRTAQLETSAGSVNSSNAKMYPHMVQPNSKNAAIYENTVLRFPVVKNNTGADYVAWTPVGSEIYIFVGLLTGKTVDISVDANIYGRKVEGKVLSNCTLHTEDVTSTIRISSTGEAYALLRVY